MAQHKASPSRKQFDRGNRTKSESLCGLEEVLSCLQPSEFEDEQLSRYKGMCWMDFVAYKEGGPPGPESPLSTEAQDHPLLPESSSTNPPMVALNDRALLITPNRPESKHETRYDPLPEPTSASKSDSADKQEKQDRVSALLCLERETPLPRKRHPMTIMRTMSERSLDRGRSGLLNLLAERYHADRSPSKTLSKTGSTKSTMSSASAAMTTGGLASVERALEAARETVRATITKTETKRREAVWDLFQSECAFLYDHLMVLKNMEAETDRQDRQLDGWSER
ncbi:hypothetical protein Pcinc_042476 [Petrolisthes cinctipes]|uniref:Uncharacterized protein n=1 Tax=Petrolisthes cinctipes TaxID=88211 RepID=A0AAE1BHN9_PETCI|nr:hypothetical protein Pcinc_042476 [Petrolisthes cinctipes]